jgi:hypothetical protein
MNFVYGYSWLIATALQGMECGIIGLFSTIAEPASFSKRRNRHG